MSYGNTFVFLQFSAFFLNQKLQEKKVFKQIKVYNKHRARRLQAQKIPRLLSYYYRCCSWCTGLTYPRKAQSPTTKVNKWELATTIKNNFVNVWGFVALDAQVRPYRQFVCFLYLFGKQLNKSPLTPCLSCQSVRCRWRHSVKMREHYTTKSKQKKEASFCIANQHLGHD